MLRCFCQRKREAVQVSVVSSLPIEAFQRSSARFAATACSPSAPHVFRHAAIAAILLALRDATGVKPTATSNGPRAARSCN
jgi:hypothetical protein